MFPGGATLGTKTAQLVDADAALQGTTSGAPAKGGATLGDAASAVRDAALAAGAA